MFNIWKGLYYGIVYWCSEYGIQGFIDAEWIGCSINRRFYTGFALTLSGIQGSIQLFYYQQKQSV